MAQLTIIRDRAINYSGLFSAPELYKLIDTFFGEHGYEKNEINNEEHVSETGKELTLEIMPTKFLTDYVKLKIHIEMTCFDVTEVNIEKDGIKVKMNKGRIEMVVSAYLETDYERKWESKPFNYFLRTLIDKFVYKKYSEQYENELTKDTDAFCDEIKSFLNLNRY